MSIFEKFKKDLLGKPKSVSQERKKDLLEKLKYAAREFGKSGTKSDYLAVPKEQQLSIDLGDKKKFGTINKILHWIESKFTYFFPRYNLFPEVGVEERKIPGTNTRVKYFNSDEQFDQRKFIGEEDGELRLYNLEGKLYDTADKISKGEKGYVAYVITFDGKLVTHEHINVNKSEWAYRHSTLAGGKPVLCSGLMKVVNGKITYIDNNSGHYKPTSANLYNAVKKLEDLFSKDAKVACLPYWISLQKQIPLIRKIIPAKQEQVEEFLKRMEKKGKDGLTEYERHFEKIKKCNEQYEQKLLLASYKSPTFDENPKVKKMAVEHSIRRIIGANYGHKPNIDTQYNEKEAVGVNIAFRYKDDCDKFTKLIDLKKLSYICTSHQDKREIDVLLECTYDEKDRATIEKLMPNKHTVFMSTDQADKFIKDTLQIEIDSVEQLGYRFSGASK